MVFILHITTQNEWREASSLGVYEASSLKSQGYIHCSYPNQLVEVANYLYRGRNDLVLLCIDTSLVESEIRDESHAADGKPYPHIYGPLSLKAVTRVLDFKPGKGGEFQLPRSLAK